MFVGQTLALCMYIEHRAGRGSSPLYEVQPFSLSDVVSTSLEASDASHKSRV